MPGAGDHSPAPGLADASPPRSPPASRRSSSGSIPIPPASGRTRAKPSGAARDTSRSRSSTPPPSQAPPAPAAAEAAAAVLVHCRALIDAAGPACVAVKPQLALLERLGSPAGSRWRPPASTPAPPACSCSARQARRRPRHRHRLRPGAHGRHAAVRRRIAGLRVDAFTANPLGRDALGPLIDITHRRVRVLHARPPGTPAPPTCSTCRSRAASRCGSASRGSRTNSARASRSMTSAP